MQTTYVSGGNAAYDLERFRPRQRMRVKRPSLTVAKPSAKARARAQLMVALKVVAAAAVLLSIVVVMLYSRAVLTELNQKISAAQKELDQSLSEQMRLSAALESQVSLRNVEDYATQTLGMIPVDKNQIVYIDLSEGDKIELTSESPKQTLADKIRLAVNNVKDRLAQPQE